MRRLALLGLAIPFASPLFAQSNTVPGLDGRLYLVDNLTYFDRRGPAHPNGELGLAMLNTMCNPGTVPIPWFAAMAADHPKFGFLLTRESDGRMVQISDRSFCKHAFVSTNSSGPCGTCQPNPFGGAQMGVHCSDTYGAGNNASQTDLGPPDELDPWLGTWNPIGSYFDRGDPDIGPPGNTDGNYSLNTAGFDGVQSRLAVKESDLLVPGARYFYGIHLMHQGEAAANRGDNLASRGFSPSWNGTSWTFANNNVGQVWGSILQHWTGATLGSGGNGNSDGSFVVAVKVTPAAAGFHYEYAVHNVDNNRGGASFRVPVDPAATVSAFGFRDIDGNALNNWTGSRIGNEIVFSAAANNALNWNSIYNFWFDCSRAPGAGQATIDEARVGPGALTVSVNTSVPAGTPVAFATAIGTGCAGSAGPCRTSAYEFFVNPGSFDLGAVPWSLTFGGGNYTLGPATGGYVPPSGGAVALPMGDDTDASVALPFSLPFPGGTTTQLVVCSNGFVSPAGGGTSYDPTISELLTASPRWALAWHDFNPGSGGSVLVDSSLSEVRVTFLGVVNFSGPGTNTFQCRFQPSGRVDVYYPAMALAGNSVLVGWSPGNNSPDPGNSNLSVVIPANNLVLCAGASQPPLTLSTANRPVLGTTVNMLTSNIPAASPFALLLYSVPGAFPPTDLGPVGMAGCFAYITLGNFTTFAVAVGPPASFSSPINIPPFAAFIGVPVTFQSISYSPPLTPLGWLTSNGLVLVLASI